MFHDVARELRVRGTGTQKFFVFIFRSFISRSLLYHNTRPTRRAITRRSCYGLRAEYWLCLLHVHRLALPARRLRIPYDTWKVSPVPCVVTMRDFFARGNIDDGNNVARNRRSLSVSPFHKLQHQRNDR